MHTNARDPGVASSDPKGEVSASTGNSPGAPAESPVERRTIRETRRVSDRIHTRQTTAAHGAKDGSRRDPPGTTHRGAPNGYDAERAQRPFPQQGPAAGIMSLVLGPPPRVPRSHQVKPGATAPGVGEGTTATGSRPDHRERPNQTRHGTPTRGHKARQRGTPLATTTAGGQVPSHNGHRVP